METVEKPKIRIDFTDSGVKTLNGFSDIFSIFSVLSILGFFICLFLFFNAYNEREAQMFLSLIITFLASFFGLAATAAICKGLSTIARTALYQRTIIENKYTIETGATPKKITYPDNLVGEWADPGLGNVIVFKKNGSFYMQTIFSDEAKSEAVKQIAVTKWGLEVYHELDNSHEFWQIASNGRLVFYDDQGNISLEMKLSAGGCY